MTKIYKVGKTGSYRKYFNDALAVMFQAGVEPFTASDLADWSGLPSGHFTEVLARYVRRKMIVRVSVGTRHEYWFDPLYWQ